MIHKNIENTEIYKRYINYVIPEIYLLTPIIIPYIGKIERLRTSFALILALGRQGNKGATDFLLELFTQLSHL